MLKVRVYVSPLSDGQLDLEAEADTVRLLVGHEWLEYGDMGGSTSLVVDFSKALAVHISPWTEAEGIKEE